MRVLLGPLGEVAGAGRYGGSAEGEESQTGRGGHDSGPHPRRAPGGSGSTSAMRDEGGDRGLLAAELVGHGGRAGGREQLVECGVRGAG
ncbi:hypothetical protein ACQP2F_10140 [Actinoplanes sp. CA-030573]|uniref:hypothetical protein n=1 Tax=Actinoplanes sp. CA-030573 TaxID=3239898 RepID=UPI003D90BD40